MINIGIQEGFEHDNKLGKSHAQTLENMKWNCGKEKYDKQSGSLCSDVQIADLKRWVIID
jgi:hypothetical protein